MKEWVTAHKFISHLSSIDNRKVVDTNQYSSKNVLEVYYFSCNNACNVARPVLGVDATFNGPTRGEYRRNDPRSFGSVLDHAMFLTIVFDSYGHKNMYRNKLRTEIRMSLGKMVAEPEPRDMTAGTKAHSVHIEFCVS